MRNHRWLLSRQLPSAPTVSTRPLLAPACLLPSDFEDAPRCRPLPIPPRPPQANDPVLVAWLALDGSGRRGWPSSRRWLMLEITVKLRRGQPLSCAFGGVLRGLSSKLSMSARREITKKYAREYQRASKKQRGVLLDGLCQATGWSRDNARRGRSRMRPSGAGSTWLPTVATT